MDSFYNCQECSAVFVPTEQNPDICPSCAGVENPAVTECLFAAIGSAIEEQGFSLTPEVCDEIWNLAREVTNPDAAGEARIAAFRDLYLNDRKENRE
jgi:hypothetical protein